MICEYKKSGQRYWDMKHRFVHTTTEPCTYSAKFIVTAKKRIMRVCGVHKNSIIAHSKKVGYSVNIKLLLIIFAVVILPIIARDCSNDPAKNPCQIVEVSK